MLFVSLLYCSPLLPEWTASLLDPEKSFSEKVVQDIEENHSFYHEYAQWVFANFNTERYISMEDWTRLAAQYFEPIKEAWSAKRTKAS